MKGIRIKYIVTAVFFLGASLMASNALAQNIECGSTYTVQPGDSLTEIAQRAYGSFEAYRILYSHNEEGIGTNPERIVPDMVLNIPCLEDELPATGKKDNKDIKDKKVAAVQPSVSSPATDKTYRFIVYDAWAPFLDKNEVDGGILTHLVRRSMQEAPNKPDFKMDFTSDFSLILNPLITDHAYDMSIGYTKPDCDSFDELGEESQFRCTALSWSEPIFEEVLTYFSLNEATTYQTHDELAGTRVCRPEGFTTAAMDTAGVKEPIVTMVRPLEPIDCIKALIESEADVAVLATDVAESAAKELGVEQSIRTQDVLNHVSTVHVIAAKDNPYADEMIAALDDGLSQLKTSGEWFEIVLEKMSVHNASQ